MRVDAAGKSSTVFDMRKQSIARSLAVVGDNAGCLGLSHSAVNSRETTADVRLGGTRRASRRPLQRGHVSQAGDLELRRRYCVIRTVRRASVELRYSDPSGIVDFCVTGSEPASVIWTLASECSAFCVQRECVFMLHVRYVL